jgi:membrane protease YdiL (CAAX protease family)
MVKETSMSEDSLRGAGRFRDTGFFMLAWTLWLLLIFACGFLLDDLLHDVFLRYPTVYYIVSGAMELLLLLPALAYAQIRRVSVPKLFGRARASQVVSAAFAGMLLVPVVLPLNAFWMLLISVTGGDPWSVGMIPPPQNAFQFLAAFGVAAVAAPLVEEPLMRGLALGGSAGTIGRTRAMLLISAIFTLAHGRLVGIPSIFLAGVLLAAFAWRTGSLWPAVAMHASYNALIVILQTVSGGIRGITGVMGGLPIPDATMFVYSCVYLVLAIPFAGALAALLWAVMRYTPGAGRPKAGAGGAVFSKSWPWIVTSALLLGYLAMDTLRVYGIISFTG